MAGAFTYAPAIVLLPFLSFVIAIAASIFAHGRRVLPKGGAIAGISATGISLLLSVWMLFAVAGGRVYDHTFYTWVPGTAGTFSLTFGILIDHLAALMLVIVTLISFLVHVFSLGYMNDEGEIGLPRYYAGLGLFTASMLGFVVSNNLFAAFVFFELVGFCSWLLIGFWFRERGPPSAAKKAFLITRFGDFFLLVGVVAIFATFGTSQFAGQGSFPRLAEEALKQGKTFFGYSAQNWITIIGLLVLGGVVGKSSQFPLHTWLPDAMEGPTPVSALIHAATMVAAGVYLVARMYGFYALSPTALAIIALIGGFTALFAATMGMVKREIKQVLAYSTISQYGYMMLGLGAGGYFAAVFHLMTHAFFKALLFMGAGAVIIAMHHDENMWKMGGLKDKMPVTYWTFLAGSLALAGIFPFAGFWSKDEVLYQSLAQGLNGHPLLLLAYLMGLVGVFFSGFYTFRMFFLTFHGEPRSDTARDPHGVRWNVKGPLVVLGVLATVAGLINMTPIEAATGLDIGYLQQWLASGGSIGATHYGELVRQFAGYQEQTAVVGPIVASVISLIVALVGVGLAWMLYNVPEPEEHTDRLGAAKDLLYNNYYQDEYQVWLGQTVGLGAARAADTFDQGIVDGVVNGVSSVSLFSGSRIKRVQTGVVSNYATLLTLGVLALIVVLGLYGGWFM